MLLELRTLMLCLVQLSKWRECKATDAEKVLSQWEKGAKCNFKSTLKYMKDVSFMKWNVICNAEDRFHVLELFCRASHVRASMHRITSLELLRTLMMCLVQMKRMKIIAKDAEKLLSQWEKVAKCNFKSKAQVHEMFLSHEMKCYLQCRRQILMLELFAEQVMLELQCTESLV